MKPVGCQGRAAALLALALLGGASAQGTLRIGAVTSLSGRFATFGQMQQAGYKVAIEEINAKGGVNGQKLELALLDDASDTNKALSAAETLVNQKVPLVMGAYSSGITKPLSQYMARVKVPLLVSTAVDETITKPGNAYTFRINNQSSVYTRSLIDQLRKMQGLKTVAVLTSNDAFGKSVLTDVTNLLPKSGFQIVGRDTYDQGLTDFRPILNRYRGQNPDVVIFASYEQDAVALAKQVRETGLNPQVLAGIATGFALPDFLKGAGASAENFLVTMVWNSDVGYPGAQNLYTRLKAALGGQEPSQHAAESYAAVIAAADAIRRAGGSDPEKVRAALIATQLSTAFGPVTFKTYGGYQNQNSLVSLITQVQKGKFVTVAPATAAKGTLVLPKR